MQLCRRHAACQEVSGKSARGFVYLHAAKQSDPPRGGPGRVESSSLRQGRACSYFLKRRLLRQALSSGLPRLLRSCPEWRIPTVPRLQDFP